MKKILLLFLVVILLLSACSCTIIYGKAFVEIKDKNGEDMSLAVLTDEDICSDEPKKYCFAFFVPGEGEHSYPEDESPYGDNAVQSYIAKSPFSGVGVVQATLCQNSGASFTVTSTVTSGNCRIVLIDAKTSTIIYDFALNTTETYEVPFTADGEYQIRVAGESAEFEINVVREMKSDAQ